METLRHTMTNDKLNELYRQLDNFIADSTWEEVQEHLPALNEVKTMIHQRMNENNEKVKKEKKSVCNDCVQFYWCKNTEKGKNRCELFTEKPFYKKDKGE